MYYSQDEWLNAQEKGKDGNRHGYKPNAESSRQPNNAAKNEGEREKKIIVTHKTRVK